MPKHRIMDTTGHSEVSFDTANKVELKEAMDRFAALTKKGFIAAKTTAPGEHVKITKFDPDADTLFIPQMQGG